MNDYPAMDRLGDQLDAVRAEYQSIVDKFGEDQSTWPAGQVERKARLSKQEDRLMADYNLALSRAEQVAAVRAAAQDPKNREAGFAVPGSDVIVRNKRNPWLDDDESPTGIRSRALDAIERAQGEHVTGDDRDAITRTVERDRSGKTAEYVIAASDPAYERAFLALAADPMNGHRSWAADELHAYRRVEAVRAAMSLTDANGGYLVPFTHDPAILLSSAGALNPLRQVCRVEQIVTDNWNGVSSAGVTAEWLAEATEAADASPTVAGPSIPVHKAAAYVQASLEVSQDSNIGQQIGMLFADARNVQEGAAFVLGTGSGQPHGVVDALIDASKTVASATADTFASADVYNLMAGVPARFRPNMVIIGGLPTIFSIAKFESTAGARLFPEVADGRILNRQLIEVTGMDEVVNAAAENYILAAFDPKSYVIVDRLGSSVVFDPLVRGSNRRPTGEVSWTLFYRVGADLPVTNAGRVLNVT